MRFGQFYRFRALQRSQAAAYAIPVASHFFLQANTRLQA